MRNHEPTRKYRYKIADLRQEGKTFEEAEDIVLKGQSNKAKYLKSYKKRGLYPYGEVDKPHKTTQPSNVVPEDNHDLPQATVVDTNDSLKIDKIEEVIDMTLEARVKALEDRLSCSADGGLLRPRLQRNACRPTSFRLPKDLLKRATEKARSDPVGVMGLNAIVELLLFQYIGSPKDLLE